MGSTSRTSETKNSNVLVAYFSHSGNTREVAEQVHQRVGGDLFPIVPVDPYPADYDAVVEKARQELNEGLRPKLNSKVEDIGRYDTVFVGYPDWWGTIPMPVATFLAENDLSGKAIVPFCTHEGSGLGRSADDIRELCPRSTVRDGLAVRGRNAKKAQSEITVWLASNDPR